MKKIYLTFCITFISLLLFAQNSDYFYYYKGKKQYLELNKDYVFIQATGKNVLQKSKIVKNSLVHDKNCQSPLNLLFFKTCQALKT